MYSREESRKIRFEFWEAFGYFSSRIGGVRGMKRRWILGNTGIKGVELKFGADSQKAEVMLEISFSNLDKQQQVFDFLIRYKTLFNPFFKQNVVWESGYPVEGKTVARIFILIQKVSIYKQSDWPTIFQFFKTGMMSMEKAFNELKPILEDYINQWNSENKL